MVLRSRTGGRLNCPIVPHQASKTSRQGIATATHIIMGVSINGEFPIFCMVYFIEDPFILYMYI